MPKQLKSKKELDRVEHLKKYFKAFQYFKATMDMDIDGLKQAALCKVEGVATAASFIKAGNVEGNSTLYQ